MTNASEIDPRIKIEANLLPVHNREEGSLEMYRPNENGYNGAAPYRDESDEEVSPTRVPPEQSRASAKDPSTVRIN